MIHSTSNITSCTVLNEGKTNFLTDNEEELLKQIRNYGKFNFDSMNIAFNDVFKNEDYNDPKVDHETMYKCLSDGGAIADEMNANNEQIIVDFSANRRLLRDSIINITVKETKELIECQNKDKTDVSPLNLSNFISPTDSKTTTKTLDTTSTKSSQTDVSVKKKRSFRPKITINNCNGIINLRNIANLTINCAKESSIRKEKSSAESNSLNKECSVKEEETVSSTTKDESDEIEGNCEFYNRLLNEIKKSLIKKTQTYPLPSSGEEENIDVPVEEDVLATPDSTDDIENAANHKFVLKNFENLKVIFENVSGTEFHPIQIEQWLAEIVSETEVEPNTGEIFEHSEITP